MKKFSLRFLCLRFAILSFRINRLNQKRITLSNKIAGRMGGIYER